MTNTHRQTQSERADRAEKLRSAEKAASRPGAGHREQADLKLARQAAAAAKLREKDAGRSAATKKGKLDKALEDTFPGSDPVSMVEAGPPKEKKPGDSSER